MSESNRVGTRGSGFGARESEGAAVEISRRDVLRRVAAAFIAAGTIDRASAQEVHHLATMAQAASGGSYTPVSLTAVEFKTLERLTDLIIPVENGAPGALAAGAANWIDTMLSENAK